MPYISEWKSIDLTSPLPPGVSRNPNFKCRCGEKNNIEGRTWESSDGAFEDYHYRCVACGHDWWVDGPDA